MVTNASDRRSAVAEVSVVALSRLFSSGVFRELGAMGYSKTAAGVVKEARFLPQENQSLANYFEEAFRLLARTLRSEYIFKNAIAERILLGKHNLSTASMLTEFRAGQHKADAVILNGTATVYEIKSERDKLDRLEGQLNSYLRIFEKVVVVADECHCEALLSVLPPDVGLQILGPRYQFKTIREAHSDLGRLDPIQMFDSLQREEFLWVLSETIGWDGSDVPNGLIHSVARNEFNKIPPDQVHKFFVASLRKRSQRKNQNEFIERVPKVLKAMAISIPLKASEQERILDSLSNQAQLALAR